jgi:hypothetical protein
MRMIGRCELEHCSTVRASVIIESRRGLLSDHDFTSSSGPRVHQEIEYEASIHSLFRNQVGSQYYHLASFHIHSTVSYKTDIMTLFTHLSQSLHKTLSLIYWTAPLLNNSLCNSYSFASKKRHIAPCENRTHVFPIQSERLL